MFNTSIDLNKILGNRQRVLVTGGAGFIGSAIIRRLIGETSAKIFNLDKIGYASDLTSIREILNNKSIKERENYKLLKVDLADPYTTYKAIKEADPDLVMHLAAESHVDRSIESPSNFISSNVMGTFNLLEAAKDHYHSLPIKRKRNFRIHHISTDEVFGSLGPTESFSEASPYDPKSPYSASKAASDHLMRSWHNTYDLPIIITNCSNNFGPWQFPEKLISKAITNALLGKQISLYGDGKYVRDWLYIEDHVDALLLASNKGLIGSTYCIGGDCEKTNIDVLMSICSLLDKEIPSKNKYSELIVSTTDRRGHDRRYSIDHQKITSELGWEPRHTFKEALSKTVKWYIEHIDWAKDKNKETGI